MIVGGFDSYASDRERYQRIQEFDLAGSYDFSTITKLSPTPYATFEYGGNDAIDEVIWKADGTKFITLNLNGDVHMYSVSDRFDLSNSTITKDGLIMSLSVPDNQKYSQIKSFYNLSNIWLFELNLNFKFYNRIMELERENRFMEVFYS